MLKTLVARFLAVVIVACLGAVGATRAATVRVPLDEPTIQAGVNAADQGDTVLVAPGVYSGDGNCGISVFSNVVLRSEAGPAATVIDCENRLYVDGISIWGDGDLIPRPTICGFSIINANRPGQEGGALCFHHADPTLLDCIVAGNAARCGGAIFCRESWPTIERCVITDNTAERGGGVYCTSSSCPAIVDCVVSRNFAAIEGGGLYLGEYSSSPGAVDGCTVAANGSPSGAGIWFGRVGDITVTNTIVAFNGPGAGINCGHPTTSSAPVVNECCVFGNAGGDSLCGEYSHNFFMDPLFCDLESGDLTLCSTSPCLPEYNPWHELVGALGQGCGKCSSPVEPTSWGRLKALYLPSRD